jgi:uncharacterized protein with PIN domain
MKSKTCRSNYETKGANMENVMTVERWESLTDADRMLLRKLGVEPQVVKVKTAKVTNPITLERRMSTRNTAGQDYYVSIHRTCGCCHSKEVHEGKMTKRTPHDSFLSLLFMEIPVGEVFKQLKVVSTVCPKCNVTLAELTKEELIEMVITLREIAAKKCCL